MHDVRSKRYCQLCGEDLLRKERPYCKFCNSPFDLRSRIVLSIDALAPEPSLVSCFRVASNEHLWLAYGDRHDDKALEVEHPLKEGARQQWRSLWTSAYLLTNGGYRTREAEKLGEFGRLYGANPQHGANPQQQSVPALPRHPPSKSFVALRERIRGIPSGIEGLVAKIVTQHGREYAEVDGYGTINPSGEGRVWERVAGSAFDAVPARKSPVIWNAGLCPPLHEDLVSL